MNINFSFLSPGLYSSQGYASPSIEVRALSTRRMLCLSTGNLDQDKFGGSGYAGGNAEEEDGGSLF